MVAFLLRAGIVILAFGVVLLLLDAFLYKENSSFSGYISQVFYLGAGVMIAGAALWLLRAFFGLIAIKKCPRCGRPVERNEIYCATHLKQAIDEYKDHMHSINRL